MNDATAIATTIHVTQPMRRDLAELVARGGSVLARRPTLAVELCLAYVRAEIETGRLEPGDLMGARINAK